MNMIISVFLTFFLILIFPFVIISCVLVFTSQSVITSVTAFAFVSFFLACSSVLVKMRYNKVLNSLIPVSLFAFSIIVIFSGFLLAREEIIEKSYGLRSVYEKDTKQSSFNPLIFIKEIDQVSLGALIIPFIDDLIDSSKGKKLRNMINTVYDEMYSDPDFAGAGSSLNYAYSEIMGFKPVHEHTYVYIPEMNDSKKLPVILFLHGSLGNFKLYLWILKKFADENRFALVAPTFGMGNWDREGGLTAIENAVNLCISEPLLDENQIILSGLSNGGIGVTKAAISNPELFKGLIYISAVLAHELTDSRFFIEKWKDKPILVIHGAEDDRVPLSNIIDVLEIFNNDSINYSFELIQSEDHFLMLSKRDILSDLLKKWIGGGVDRL